MVYKYSVEIFKDSYWQVDIRYYYCKKSLNEFDLYDVPNKRRNARFIGVTGVFTKF